LRERSTPTRRTAVRRLLVFLAFFGALCRALPASAADANVRVDCPELTPEQTAEVESRARASLLTADLNATASILCREGAAQVRVEGAGGAATVQLHTTAEGFRDELLRALDEALRQLFRAREEKPLEPGTAPEPPSPPAEHGSTPEPSERPAVTPGQAHTQAQTQTPPQPIPAFDEAEVAVSGERWPGRWALGAALSVARTRGWMSLGLRIGVVRPLKQRAEFGATEVAGALEFSTTPRPLGGARLTLGVGPSVLLIAPRADFVARFGTAKSAVFVEAELSRRFSIGRMSLIPALGVRIFGAPRGVHVGSHPVDVLGGAVPYLLMGAAYRD